MKDSALKSSAPRSTSQQRLEPVSNQRLDRQLLPTPQEHAKFLANWKHDKQKLPKQVLLAILKAKEEELLRCLATTGRRDGASDYLAVPSPSAPSIVSSFAPAASKIIFHKDHFAIDFTLNNKSYVVPFSQFEKAQALFEQRAVLTARAREMIQLFKKVTVALKEKKKNAEHNVNQFTVLLNFKIKEIEKLEKNYKKMVPAKGGKTTRGVLGKIF